MKALQSSLPFLPEDAILLSDVLAYSNNDGFIQFFNATGIIYRCLENDKDSLYYALGMFSELKLAKIRDLSNNFAVSDSTIYRYKDKFKKGCKSKIQVSTQVQSSKLNNEKINIAQYYLNNGDSIRSAAKKLNISEGTIRYAIKMKRIVYSETIPAKKPLKAPSQRSIDDLQGSQGIGVKRNVERALARMGRIKEANPVFEAVDGLARVGVFLSLPMLLSQGLIEVGEEVFGSLKQGFFGLRSVLLCIAFMSLLRIKNIEQLKEHSPGELGILLGMDRFPEVKTIRRKIEEIGQKGRSKEFSKQLSKRWADESPQTLGFLYIDGHVRAYNGKKKIPKTHISRRRLCMPATTDFWVNESNSEPLFMVTTEANDSMLKVIENEILPEIKRVVTAERRITLVFDREGWSPNSFQRWDKKGFDILTYRKGNYDPWPLENFIEVEKVICGNIVKYNLGQRSIKLSNGMWVREIRRLCKNGHQTSIITTLQKPCFVELAYRMFFRWSQENYFKYMRQEYNIDHLYTYKTVQADPNRLVPNPHRKLFQKEYNSIKYQIDKTMKEYGEISLQKNNDNGDKSNNKKNKKKTKSSNKKNLTSQSTNSNQSDVDELEVKINELQMKIKDFQEKQNILKEKIKNQPEKIKIKEIFNNDDDIVMLETERKMFIDTIKMLCYRAETELFNLIYPFFSRHADEGRAFIRSIFYLSGDIIPDDESGHIKIRYHTLVNRRANMALKEICKLMNEKQIRYPGTKKIIIYESQQDELI
ncbi:MAG: hypothetical protein OMM_04743 [Candidatus Magnetoglobus multicellularis str. Araruama]|uniref:Nuclease-associated modular DNA-binding 1 domain-containing protein n=1 Tax=Candidatus Magnetoglobus multicellularis str. Araruama TaxID=890399 RepID=A0A1V1NZX7_9BACT|nr:MAG: hypothetical protein OMM_04743 [Candidatus Magnetoglobus multicellularis str. Araruama]